MPADRFYNTQRQLNRISIYVDSPELVLRLAEDYHDKLMRQLRVNPKDESGRLRRAWDFIGQPERTKKGAWRVVIGNQDMLGDRKKSGTRLGYIATFLMKRYGGENLKQMRKNRRAALYEHAEKTLKRSIEEKLNQRTAVAASRELQRTLADQGIFDKNKFPIQLSRAEGITGRQRNAVMIKLTSQITNMENVYKLSQLDYKALRKYIRELEGNIREAHRLRIEVGGSFEERNYLDKSLMAAHNKDVEKRLAAREKRASQYERQANARFLKDLKAEQVRIETAIADQQGKWTRMLQDRNQLRKGRQLVGLPATGKPGAGDTHKPGKLIADRLARLRSRLKEVKLSIVHAENYGRAEFSGPNLKHLSDTSMKRMHELEFKPTYHTIIGMKELLTTYKAAFRLKSSMTAVTNRHVRGTKGGELPGTRKYGTRPSAKKTSGLVHFYEVLSAKYSKLETYSLKIVQHFAKNRIPKEFR